MQFHLASASAVVVLTSAALLIFSPLQATAQAGHSGGEDYSADSSLSDIMTTSTVRNLQSVATECSDRPPVYQLDCLRQGFELVWRSIPYHGAYGDMRTAIQRATAGIGDLVEKDRDSSAPRLDSGLSSNPRFKARRHYSAILSTKVADARAATQKILSDVSAVLDQHDGYGRVGAALRQISTDL